MVIVCSQCRQRNTERRNRRRTNRFHQCTQVGNVEGIEGIEGIEVMSWGGLLDYPGPLLLSSIPHSVSVMRLLYIRACVCFEKGDR